MSTTPKLPGSFANTIIPMVRKMIPSMIANDIIGVQPISGPAGSIFTMRARFGPSELNDWLNEAFGTPKAGTPDYELDKYMREDKPQATFN